MDAADGPSISGSTHAGSRPRISRTAPNPSTRPRNLTLGGTASHAQCRATENHDMLVHVRNYRFPFDMYLKFSDSHRIRYICDMNFLERCSVKGDRERLFIFLHALIATLCTVSTLVHSQSILFSLKKKKEKRFPGNY